MFKEPDEFILNVILDSSADIPESHFETGFEKTYLIPEEFYDKINISGNLRSSIFIYSYTMGKINIEEVYSIPNFNATRVPVRQFCGNWTISDGLNWPVWKIERRSDLRGVTLANSYYPFSPLMTFDTKTNEPVSYMSAILKHMESMLNFETSHRSVAKFGDIFSGFKNHSYDFSTSPLTMTRDRIDFMDISFGIFTETWGLMKLRSKSNSLNRSNFYVYLNIFTKNSWICIALACLIFTGSIFMTSGSNWSPTFISLPLTNLGQLDVPYNQPYLSSKCVYITLSAFSLIIFAYFNGSVTRFSDFLPNLVELL